MIQPKDINELKRLSNSRSCLFHYKEVHVSTRKYRERSQESSIRRACLFLKLHVSEEVETNLCKIKLEEHIKM